jgi:hypothetical protein
MQKVVGSSPISRFRSTCKSATSAPNSSRRSSARRAPSGHPAQVNVPTPFGPDPQTRLSSGLSRSFELLTFRAGVRGSASRTPSSGMSMNQPVKLLPAPLTEAELAARSRARQSSAIHATGLEPSIRRSGSASSLTRRYWLVGAGLDVHHGSVMRTRRRCRSTEGRCRRSRRGRKKPSRRHFHSLRRQPRDVLSLEPAPRCARGCHRSQRTTGAHAATIRPERRRSRRFSEDVSFRYGRLWSGIEARPPRSVPDVRGSAPERSRRRSP